MKKLIFIFLLMLFACNSKVRETIETCQVKKGEFLVDVTETGELQATQSLNISSPAMSWRFGQLKITKIVEDGTEVAEGDTVILFDPSEVQKAIVNAQAELEIAKAELEKLGAEQQSRIKELEADLRIAQVSYEISEIELEQAKYESDVQKKEIRLNLDQAKISLDKARDEIKNQSDIHKEERHQAQLKIKQLESNLEEAHETLRNLTVISKGSGVAITRKNWHTGNKWQVGDQPWSGMPLIDLPDLSELKVETEINEVDISKIQLDQEVTVRLDAFSDTSFSGSVMSIASLAQNKQIEHNKDSQIKIFPVSILLNGASKELMPGMTVSCKIVVDKIPEVIFIPLEAVVKKEDQDFVYVKSAGAFKPQSVTLGLANNDYVIVEHGLDEGDQIALCNPFESESDEEASHES